jgi:uncharacterized protein YvpB
MALTSPKRAHVRAQNPLNAHWRHLVVLLRVSGVLIFAFIVVMGALIWLRSNESSVFAQANDESVSADSGGEGPTENVTVLAGNSVEQVIRAALLSDVNIVSQRAGELVAEVRKAALRAAAGWRAAEGGRYYYLEDGRRATGTLTLNGVTLSFDEQGLWLSSRLDVPYISQLPDMPSGCEIVSLTMMLSYAGIDVSKEELAERMPYAATPDEGFTGSLYADGALSYSGVIWPTGLLELAQSYQPSAVDLTGASWEALQGSIDEGKPVCVWLTSDGLDHTVLLTGYSATTVWVNDPLANKDIELNLAAFQAAWERNAYRALSY